MLTLEGGFEPPTPSLGGTCSIQAELPERKIFKEISV